MLSESHYSQCGLYEDLKEDGWVRQLTQGASFYFLALHFRCFFFGCKDGLQ